MQRHSQLPGQTIGFALLLTIPLIGGSEQPDLPVPESSGPIPEMTRKPKVEFVRRDYHGVVSAVTGKSITVRDGVKAPKLFPANARLAAGGFLDDMMCAACRHRLTDVRVGDKVTIEYSRVDGTDYCTAITIRRRPGGRVPPCPGEPADQEHKHHEWMNARQDLEEKGIPLPEKYAPPRLEDFLAQITEVRRITEAQKGGGDPKAIERMVQGENKLKRMIEAQKAPPAR